MVENTVKSTRIEKLLSPLQNFIHQEQSGGIVLLIFTAVALVWANSPLADVYHHFKETTCTIGFGHFALAKSFEHWVNDGLMAIFFFVVGLEIKREILVGELASPKKAALPIAAALGGMVVPALIYTMFNWGSENMSGWATPMATDIAFAIGIIALLGKRVPLALKVFLAALAIVDDLGAVLVIAFFYTETLHMMALAIAGVFLVILIVCNRTGVRNPIPYALLGIGLWFFVYKSGIHATIAGVALAMTIPSRTRSDRNEFLYCLHALLKTVEDSADDEKDPQAAQKRLHAVYKIENACERTLTPLLRLEHGLHPWVTFGVMPLFALVNAGVSLGGNFSEAVMSSLGLGTALGLLFGKPLGIGLFCWITLRLGLASMPARVTGQHLLGAGMLGGIGFTMALFIANLSFPPHNLDVAKIAILIGSTISAVSGLVFLKRMSKRTADKL